MAVRERVLFGNPLLRKKSGKVADFGSEENKRITNDLKDTLLYLQKVHKKGGGLAAVQIGHGKSIICIIAKGRSFFMFNPKITKKSKKMFEVWDFCFSADAYFTAKVKRHWEVEVEYQDGNGAKRKEKASGYFSELYQHEIDHLNGILFIDRITDPKTITIMSEWEKTHCYRQD